MADIAEYKLVAVWNRKVGNEIAHNIWKVTSDIVFADGRARFTIVNGSKVDIDISQLETIRMERISESEE